MIGPNEEAHEQANGFRPSRCLTPDQIDALVANQGSADDLAAWKEHIAECPSCREDFEGQLEFCSIAEGFTEQPLLDPKLPLIPGYEVRSVLGGGGFGFVYRAYQVSAAREVAIKVMREPDHWTSGSPRADRARKAFRQRFLLERQLLAQLRHPHLMPVYEVGSFGDPEQLFFSMELCPGGSLKDRLEEGRRYTPAEAAELVRTLAEAVQVAHGQRIAHRDLKPDNVLFDELGHPKVADFGLAKRMDEEDLTTQGGAPGTPAYMAPEQVLPIEPSGAKRDVSPATDVWALGVVLYELLTGQRPFSGSTPSELSRAILEAVPMKPRKLAGNVPRDLEKICLKCLEKSPAHRYASGKELADDLGRWLNDEPVTARPPGLCRRTGRWARRHKGWTAALIVVVILVISVAAVLASGYRAAQVEARERQRELLLQDLSHLQEVSPTTGWSERAWELVRSASEIRRDQLLKDRAVSTLSGLDTVALKRYEKTDVSSVAFDPSGNRLILGGFRHPKTGAVQPTRIWDRTTDTFRTSNVQGPGPVTWNALGIPLQVTATGNTLTLWNLQEDKPLRTFRLSEDQARNPAAEPPTLSLSPGGKFLAASVVVGDDQSTILLWNTTTGALVRKWSEHATALAITRDGSHLAAGFADGSLTLWNAASETLKKLPTTRRNSITSLAFKRDFLVRDPANFQQGGYLLAVGDSGGQIAIWETKRLGVRSYCQGSRVGVYALDFSPDGTMLASAGRYHARLWDVASGRVLNLLGYRNAMTGIAFSADGRQVAVTSQRVFVRYPGGFDVWQLQNGRGIASLRGLRSPISMVWFSSKGNLVAALSDDWQLGLWDANTRQLKCVLELPEGWTSDNAALAIDPDEERLAFATGTVALLWDLNTTAMRSWKLPRGLWDQLAWRSENELILVRSEKVQDHWEFRVRNLLSINPHKLLDKLGPFPAPTPTLISSDGRHFAVETIDDPTQTPVREIKVFALGPQGPQQVWSYAFHRPGSSRERIRIDPANSVFSFPADGPDEQGWVNLLLNFPDGQTKQVLPVCPHGLSPGGEYWVSKWNFKTPYQSEVLWLYRRSESQPLVALTLGRTPTTVRHAFKTSGTHLAWGTADGTVSICDLQEVRERLTSAGLGW